MGVFLDDKDKLILELLTQHANWTTRQIAKKTLLPPTTINNRIRKLKSAGVIKNYTITPDYSSLDLGFAVHILIDCDIQQLREEKRTQYDIIKELRRMPFIHRADVVSGGTDIVAFVRVKDVKEFNEVLLKKIQMIDGIKNTRSLIVIHSQD